MYGLAIQDNVRRTAGGAHKRLNALRQAPVMRSGVLTEDRVRGGATLEGRMRRTEERGGRGAVVFLFGDGCSCSHLNTPPPKLARGPMKGLQAIIHFLADRLSGMPHLDVTSFFFLFFTGI